eukprot:SAG25_NODE_9116_length_387_cov_0.715278_1_plen_65_part_10
MAWRYALDSATHEAAAARLDLAELYLATHQLVHAHGDCRLRNYLSANAAAWNTVPGTTDDFYVLR